MDEAIVLIKSVQRFLSSIDELQVIPEVWPQLRHDIEQNLQKLDSAMLLIDDGEESEDSDSSKRIRELERKIERACEALGC